MGISSLAAYAFAKCEFKGQRLIFTLLLATMMIPQELTIPPLYLMLSRVKMLNTYSVQILPSVANVFALFMLRQYMLSIPNGILQAAKIDGAGHWQTFIRIMLPMITPVLSALGILVFLGKWNDYLWPSIMVNNERLLPILVILPRLTVGTNAFSVPWELILAGCSVATVPLFIVFFIFQKQFMATVVLGSVKE